MLANLPSQCDALVIGAGPAGAFASYLMARQGWRVILADRAKFPRYKVCGCCLNPRTCAMLKSVGMGRVCDSAIPIQYLELASGGVTNQIRLNGWQVLSRELFDTGLIQAAIDAGTTFLPETNFVSSSVEPDHRECTLHSNGQSLAIRASVVIAADGLSGTTMTHQHRNQVEVESGSRIGAGTVVDESDHYLPHHIFMACGPNGYVGLVRIEDGRLNIAAAFDRQFLKSTPTLGSAANSILIAAGFPALPQLNESNWKGTVPLTRHPRHVALDRLLAIGDAAGYVEPFTGEGIGWALDSAIDVAAILNKGWQPEADKRWRRLHAARVYRRSRLIRPVAWGLRQPLVTSIALNLMRTFPTLTGRVIDRWFTPGSIRRLRQ